MPHDLRAHVPGDSYFFTVALLERWRCLLTAHIDALRAAFRSVHIQRPFRIDAIVILLDHLHCIWTPSDADFSTRRRLIKASFAPRRGAGGAVIIEGKRNTNGAFGNGDSGNTRSGINEISMRTSTYLHFNPVKHGWVSRVANWPHSSFHRFRALGVVSTGMGGPGRRR